MSDLDKYHPMLDPSETPVGKLPMDVFLDRFFSEESPPTLHEPLVQIVNMASNAVVKSAKEMENLDSYND